MTPPVALPRVVIFDWDNTLVDSWGCIHASVNVTLEAMGHPTWTMEDARRRVRRSMRDAFPEMFGDRWEQARAIFYDHFAANHMKHLQALPGAAALLTALREAGVYLAVVSNKTGGYLRREAAALGWDAHFGRLVGATDASADKPAVAPVELALQPAGLTLASVVREQVWFVGDADIDMECAHAAGCLPVLVGGEGDSDFTRHPPALRFKDCTALCDLVRRLGAPISSSTCGIPACGSGLSSL